LGGRQGRDAALGQVIGPSFAAPEMPDVVSKLIDTYVALRHEDERFVDTVDRVGLAPFKAGVYGEPKELARAA
jgi:sulfite reductase (NADPH) hemoprotein beta-component